MARVGALWPTIRELVGERREVEGEGERGQLGVRLGGTMGRGEGARPCCSVLSVRRDAPA
jgi:hypothetical protein